MVEKTREQEIQDAVEILVTEFTDPDGTRPERILCRQATDGEYACQAWIPGEKYPDAAIVRIPSDTLAES